MLCIFDERKACGYLLGCPENQLSSIGSEIDSEYSCHGCTPDVSIRANTDAVIERIEGDGCSSIDKCSCSGVKNKEVASRSTTGYSVDIVVHRIGNQIGNFHDIGNIR